MRLGIPPLSLSEEEKETLEQWVRRPKTAQALAQRARIVLRCAEGKTNTDVAAELNLSKPTVGKWRSRFLERRLDGLGGRATIGAPQESLRESLTLTLETTPAEATLPQWPGAWVSRSTISRIWRAFALRLTAPRPSSCRRTRSLSRRFVTLWVSTSTRRTRALSCVSTRRLRSRHWTRRGRCCPCAQARRRGAPMITFGIHYRLFAALDTRTGKVIGRFTARRFRKFLDTIEASVLLMHLILDNYGTHKTALIPFEPLHPHQRFLAQLGGAVVCPAYRKATASWSTPEQP